MYRNFSDSGNMGVDYTVGFVIFHADLLTINPIRQGGSFGCDRHSMFDGFYDDGFIPANDAYVILCNHITQAHIAFCFRSDNRVSRRKAALTVSELFDTI